MATDNAIYPTDTDADSTTTIYGYNNQDSTYYPVLTIHNVAANAPYVTVFDTALLGAVSFTDRYNAKSDLGHQHSTSDIDGLNALLANTPNIDYTWDISHVSGLQTALDTFTAEFAGLATVATTGAYSDLTGKPATRTSSPVTHSIVTGTGATGFQVSSSRDSFVNYSVTIVSTATIGSNQDGTVVLEIAPTNSATAGDWIEVARFRNGQTLALALTLSSVQTVSGNLGGYIPAGYYVKLRSINNSGTPSYAYESGQEVLM